MCIFHRRGVWVFLCTRDRRPLRRGAWLATLAGMTNAVPDPAFNLPTKPLSQSRVAIVTTAALRLPDQDKYLGGDQSFRVLPATTERLILGQISPNFDRSGFIIDPNVVFPMDRLREMEREGLIGS